MTDLQPPRGAFDYLLDPIRDQLQPPPPPPKRGEDARPQRIHREIAGRRGAVKSDVIGLIVVALLVWVGVGWFALLAWRGFVGR